MRVLITGVGNAFTSRYFSTSALIEAPDGYVMIDCPDLPMRVLREATETAGWDVDPAAITDIIVTHLHGDHCNGLEGLGFYRRLLAMNDPGHSRPRLHATQQVADRLWQRLAPAMDAPMDGRPSQLEDFYDVHVLAPGVSTSIAGLEVECRATFHPVPTIGLMIDGGGWTLGWSGDCEYDPEHIEWLSRASLIVHEAGNDGPHTSVEELNNLPDQLRSRIRLIHFEDAFDPSTTDMTPLAQGEVLGPSP
jgi:ribonuclease BN (tRNA processing enzyme)